MSKKNVSGDEGGLGPYYTSYWSDPVRVEIHTATIQPMDEADAKAYGVGAKPNPAQRSAYRKWIDYQRAWRGFRGPHRSEVKPESRG